ncbi:MAG TPA: DUF4214 domain-containing protein [Pyrinomonadaceae bacterium]
MSQQVSDPRKLSRSSFALVVLFGVVGTIQYHAAQFFSGFDTFPGDRGDARGFLYFCEHWFRALSGKASLLSPAVFYPAKGTLAYSDLLVGFGVPYSVFRGLGFDMFLSLEIVLFLLAFLSYCTAFFLLYKTLEFRLAPSIVGAMFFAFNSPKWFQLIHLQLQYVVLLPIIFALLITFGKQAQTLEQKRAAILLSAAALCWDLQLATAFYFAWFFVLWFTFFLVLSLAFTRTRRYFVAVCIKFWPAIAVATGTLLIGALPTLLLYVPLAGPKTYYQFDGIIPLIPDWHAFLSTGAGNYLWGGITMALLPDPIPNTWGELQVGIGLFSSATWVVLVIATIGFIRARRGVNTSGFSIPDPRQLGMLFLAVLILATSLFYVLGFRYGDHSPWYFIYEYFPGAKAIRAVSRYVIFLALPMSIAFAFVIDWGLAFALRQQSSFRRRLLATAVILLGALMAFEQFGIPKIGGSGFTVSIEKSYLQTHAAKLAKDCEAFYLANGPLAKRSMPEYQYDAMLISAVSGIPTLNASSSQFPPGWDLYSLQIPEYEDHVKSWISQQKISGKVCRLETGPEIDAFDTRYPNPINDPKFFVRQLYLDFTGDEPKGPTVMSVNDMIANCGSNPDRASCSKAQIALHVFLATGFHERGFFILRMYDAGLGRLPNNAEFTTEMDRYQNLLTTLPPETAQQRMLETFSAMLAQEGKKTDRPLSELVYSDESIRRLQNRSFVALVYFGFLRREPDEVGLVSWTDLLERRGDAAVVIEGVIISAEYRHRLAANELHARVDGGK